MDPKVRALLERAGELISSALDLVPKSDMALRDDIECIDQSLDELLESTE
jgi:hypothetical protein